jgi:hypothetical protein
MSLFRSGPAVSCLALVLGLGLTARGQEGPPAPPKDKGAAKVMRLVYAVRSGSAKELATALAPAFKAEAAFQVVPEEGSNSLLLSGPQPP